MKLLVTFTPGDNLDPETFDAWMDELCEHYLKTERIALLSQPAAVPLALAKVIGEHLEGIEPRACPELGIYVDLGADFQPVLDLFSREYQDYECVIAVVNDAMSTRILDHIDRLGEEGEIVLYAIYSETGMGHGVYEVSESALQRKLAAVES